MEVKGKLKLLIIYILKILYFNIQIASLAVVLEVFKGDIVPRSLGHDV